MASYRVVINVDKIEEHDDIDDVLVIEHVLKLTSKGELVALYAPGAWRSVVLL